MSVSKAFLAERLIAKRYEEEGYAVTLEPTRNAIPFSLEKYRPDILATKGNEHLIIEVKTAGARTDPEAYQRLAELIHSHEGWKFLLVTVSEAELEEGGSTSSSSDVEAINARLLHFKKLIDEPETAMAALPFLWTAYVSGLKMLLSAGGAQINGYTDFSIVNKAYSDGLISFDEYEAARRLMNLRNQAVHTLDVVVTAADSKQLAKMVEDILMRASNSISPQ